MNSTKTIAGTTAYLVGVPENFLKLRYDSGLIESLRNNEKASIVRCLCTLRTRLMQNFKYVDKLLVTEGLPINKCSYFDSTCFAYLDKIGVKYQLYNKKATDYITHWNKLIEQYIGACKDLYDRHIVSWDWIRGLFVYLRSGETDAQKAEYVKYTVNKNYYPYQMYVNFKVRPVGDMLHDDYTLLCVLYDDHGAKLPDEIKRKVLQVPIDAYETTQVVDAFDGNKVSDLELLRKFMDTDDRTVLAVDCENANAYRVLMLMQWLDREGRLPGKVMLFDDENTDNSWESLTVFGDVPIEHTVIKRVTKYKSLVDVYMAAGICKEYYMSKEKVRFMLVSSDSDFCGVIQALPEAKFFVVVEDKKVGTAMQIHLAESGVGCCSLSQFGTDYEVRMQLLRSAVIDKLNGLLSGVNVADIVRERGKELQMSVNGNTYEGYTTAILRSLRIVENAGQLHFEADAKNECVMSKELNGSIGTYISHVEVAESA